MNPLPVLLVEDDENDVLLIGRAFKQAEVANPLIVVDTTPGAMDYLTGRAPYVDRHQFPLPCLVLMDLNVRIGSGLEVLKWMRSQPGLKRIPVVLWTSMAPPEAIRQAYDFGVNSFLLKPRGSAELLHVVKLLRSFWLENRLASGEQQGA